MKLKKTKLLQVSKGRKRGKYLITLEVTDYDIDMLENLATCYCTKESPPPPEYDLEPKYRKWLKRAFHCFWKLWNRYDKYDIPKGKKK